jgi:hypothetical protein
MTRTGLTEDPAEALLSEVETAISDARGDHGEELIESGGWIEIVRSVVNDSAATPGVKAAVLRRHGLDP